MSKTRDISKFGYVAVRKNLIMNSDFDLWQRATSQTSSGYGSSDRWVHGSAGSTKTTSRQVFTVGQTLVPDEPTYFCRTAVTSVAGAGNLVYMMQKAESVRTLAGKTATFSFYAKADANKNIAVEFAQIFGTGGAPSADVNTIGVTTFALTTTEQKFTVTVNIPSINGKTLGTTDDGVLAVLFWFDAGSAFNSRTNSLGQQSGTFDISHVQLEEGSVATAFQKPPRADELAQCQRYYEKSYKENVALGTVTNENAGTSVRITGGYTQITYFKVPKRVNPTITIYNPINGSTGTLRNVSLGANEASSLAHSFNNSFLAFGTSVTINDAYTFHWTAEAEI